MIEEKEEVNSDEEREKLELKKKARNLYDPSEIKNKFLNAFGKL